MWRRVFYLVMALIILTTIFIGFFWPDILYSLIIILPLLAIGIYDILQTKSNILRNYPIVGHFRYMALGIRPQIQQYFIETEQSGAPFSKELRSLVYERAKGGIDTLPFGTQRDVYATRFESINHSLSPKKVDASEARVLVGNAACTQIYNASRFNISAMSFGALSSNAIRALNRGAKLGNFAHNTGEGGLSTYHLSEGGDLIWQIGTGYFGCRGKDGNFDPIQFKERAQHPHVKMIEIKLSQGAKPAHGGILLGVKVTPEIATIRGIEPWITVVSPPAHTAFTTPLGLLEFVTQLRELSGGKPVGFKLCLGSRSEFLGICKAMLKTQVYPDFITVDGAEGGTGAAPVEFSDFIGTPLDEGLVFIHNSLVGIGARHHIRIIASGKIITGFDLVTKMALGADMCNTARGMMFAVGCVQSRKCHNDTCPTGVATQDPKRVYAVDVDAKAPRVARYHHATIDSFLDVLGAVGITRVVDLQPAHIHRRINSSLVQTYDQIYEFIQKNDLLKKPFPRSFERFWEAATPYSFVNTVVD